MQINPHLLSYLNIFSTVSPCVSSGASLPKWSLTTLSSVSTMLHCLSYIMHERMRRERPQFHRESAPGWLSHVLRVTVARGVNVFQWLQLIWLSLWTRWTSVSLKFWRYTLQFCWYKSHITVKNVADVDKSLRVHLKKDLKSDNINICSCTLSGNGWKLVLFHVWTKLCATQQHLCYNLQLYW